MSSLVYEQTKISVPKNINISCSPNLIILTDFPLQYNKLVFDVSPHGITGIVSNLSQVRNRRRSLQVIAGRRRLSQVAAGRHRLSQDFADPSRSSQVVTDPCSQVVAFVASPRKFYNQRRCTVFFAPSKIFLIALLSIRLLTRYILGMALFLKGIIYDV